MAQNKKVPQKWIEYHFYIISKGIRPKKVGRGIHVQNDWQFHIDQPSQKMSDWIISNTPHRGSVCRLAVFTAMVYVFSKNEGQNN